MVMDPLPIPPINLPAPAQMPPLPPLPEELGPSVSEAERPPAPLPAAPVFTPDVTGSPLPPLQLDDLPPLQLPDAPELPPLSPGKALAAPEGVSTYSELEQAHAPLLPDLEPRDPLPRLPETTLPESVHYHGPLLPAEPEPAPLPPLGASLPVTSRGTEPSLPNLPVTQAGELPPLTAAYHEPEGYEPPALPDAGEGVSWENDSDLAEVTGLLRQIASGLQALAEAGRRKSPAVGAPQTHPLR